MSEAGRRDRWPAEFTAAAERPDRGHHDNLTGLPTRQAFLAHLQALCAQGTGSLLLCDLDHLKLINDTLGHAAGDAAIAAVAGTLRDRLQPGWAAYRLGGDEFAVLAPVPAEALEGWVRQVMAALVARPGQPLRLSAGVSGLSGACAPQDVLARVDRRLYAAKRRGRGRLVSDDDAPEQPDPDPRLLERDAALAALTTHLQAGLNTPPPDRPDGGVTVDVRADPGGGLSAFLRMANRAAQLLGYQTVTVQGTRSRRLRHYGAWSSATLNGTPVYGPAGDLGTGSAAADRDMPWPLPATLTAPNRPLALLLDRPEDFDPHTLEAIAPLRAAAWICIMGRCVTGNATPAPALPLPGAPDAGATAPPPPVIQLLPLSDSAVGAVGGRLAGGPLAGPVQAWLAQRSGGAPAEIGRWLRALLLEARLRHEDPVRLVEAAPERAGPGGDWQWSAARHLHGPTHYNRPYLWGRAALFQAALAALGRGPVVVLTGPAGRGRTRLAEQLLMEYAPHMPGGAWAVSLAGIGRTEELLSRLAQTLLGQPADLGGLESVGRLLARRPTLLLLDDLPPGVGSAALERLLSFAPDTRLIITASHPLGLRGEQVLALPLLDPDVVREALRLYPQAVNPELAARAAEWIRGEPTRLQDVLRVLSIDPSGGLLDGLLDPSPAQPARPGGLPLGLTERRTLTALGLFSDVFSLPWAQAVTGASPLTLAGLREHGYLVPVGQALYRLAGGLDVAAPREAAAQAPPLPFLRQARRRALAELRRVLARPDPDHHREWLARLDTAYVPLRSLLTGLLRGGPATGPETALVDAVVALTPYRISRTYFLDARADLEQLLRASEEAAGGESLPPRPSARLAEVRLALARTLQHLGDYAPATALTRAVRTNPGLSARLHVGALLAEARILHRRSEYSSALGTYRHAQTLLTRSGAARRAPELLAQALDGQARCLIYLDQLPLARRLSARALTALGPERDPLRRALLLNTAALIETEDRHLEAADASLRAALHLHEAHADREGQILNRMGLAWVRLLRGDGEGSVRLGRELLREAQDAAQLWEIANILLNLGHAERLCGRPGAARAHYLDVEKLVSEQDAPSLHAELLGGLAACALDEDRPAEARRLLALALGHPGANAEVRRFYAPLQTLLTGTPVEAGASRD